MKLLTLYLEKYIKKANTEGVKINILGDISRLDDKLQEKILKITNKTKDNDNIVVNIAFNYGGRAELTMATKGICKDVLEGKLNIDDINENLIENYLYTKGQPDPDLLIRTSGHERISNFLLWQVSYSELYFCDKHWPAFNKEELLKAIEVYNQRNRKYGK